MSYNVASDPMIVDLSKDIKDLDETKKKLDEELAKVSAVLKDFDADLDTEMRASVQREIHEGEEAQKKLSQELDYLIVKRKQRYNSLRIRKEHKVADLKTAAKKEADEYFLQKKLKPMQKPWEKRYRAALDIGSN